VPGEQLQQHGEEAADARSRYGEQPTVRQRKEERVVVIALCRFSWEQEVVRTGVSEEVNEGGQQVNSLAVQHHTEADVEPVHPGALVNLSVEAT
jgi:hypothetical protein